MNPWLSNLLTKRYRLPEGVAFYDDEKNPHLYAAGDWIFMDRFVTFVLPQGPGCPEPSRRWVAVGDVRPFKRGARLMIDCVDGRCEIATVKKVHDNRVIEFMSPLNISPKVMGDVYKILGNKTHVVDPNAILPEGDFHV